MLAGDATFGAWRLYALRCARISRTRCVRTGVEARISPSAALPTLQRQHQRQRHVVQRHLRRFVAARIVPDSTWLKYWRQRVRVRCCGGDAYVQEKNGEKGENAAAKMITYSILPYIHLSGGMGEGGRDIESVRDWRRLARRLKKSILPVNDVASCIAFRMAANMT